MTSPDDLPPPKDDLDFAAPIEPLLRAEPPSASEPARAAEVPPEGAPLPAAQIGAGGAPAAAIPPAAPAPTGAEEASADEGEWEHIADPEDVRKHKGVAILAYFFFFVPLVIAEKSPFARFHANQGLLILCIGGGLTFGSIILAKIAGVAFGAVLGDVWGVIFAAPLYIIAVVAWLGSLVMIFAGIARAFGGEMKELPLIGHYRIIK